MKLAVALMGAIFLSSSVMAAQNVSSVATIEALKGNILIENVDGSREVAKAKANLQEGQTLIILEKAEVSLKYASSKCAATHRGAALLKISESTQCAASQKVGVGFAGGSTSFGTATGPSFGIGGSTSFSSPGASIYAGSAYAWLPVAAATTLFVVTIIDDGPASPNN